MPPTVEEPKARKPGKIRANRPTSLFRVDWSFEMEAVCFLLFAHYNLYQVDKSLLEQIVHRAFPIFKRARKVAAAFYDRVEFRWNENREKESWHNLDRLDQRSKYHGTPHTQSQLNDFATLDAVIQSWAAHVNKTLTPGPASGLDFSSGVADPAGVLHALTDTPGTMRASLVPGQQLSQELRYKLESYYGDPIYDFHLASTLAPGVSPPNPNTTRAIARPRKTKAATKKKRSRQQEDSDSNEDDATSGPPAATTITSGQPQNISTASKKRRSRKGVGYGSDDDADGDYGAPAKSRKEQPRRRKLARQYLEEDDRDEAELGSVSDSDVHGREGPTARAPKRRHTTESSATSKPTATFSGIRRTYAEMKEEAIAASKFPQQMLMVHHDDLIFEDDSVRFKPGSDIPDSFAFPGDDVYEFGGYVYTITLDVNAPPESFIGPHGDRQAVSMTVCNTDVCDKCSGEVKEDGEKTVLDPNHSWDIVYRNQLIETADGTYVYVGYQGGKIPKYTTKLPSNAIARDVAMQFNRNGEPDRSTTFKVLVCDEEDEEELSAGQDGFELEEDLA